MSTIKNDNSAPQSFFDDKEPFTFTKVELSHMDSLGKPSKLESSILCQSNESDFNLRGLFKLHDNFIVYYMEGFSSSPAYVIDILHTSLSKVEKHSNGPKYTLRLSKNQTSFDFCFLRREEAENWRNELKSHCVLECFHEEYEPIYMLGKGAFASVYLVQHNATSINFAVKGFCKKAFKKSSSRAALMSEINMLKMIDHKNLVSLYEIYESENSIYLVMEYTTGRTLRHLLKKKNLLDPQIMEITKSILSVLTYFESQKIMHRDLKPDNILIEDDLTIKVIDFGLAAHNDTQDFLHDRCGTAGYVAPEIFAFHRYNPCSYYDNKCDVFSAGCILFQMLLGFRMFEGDDAAHTLKLNSMYGQPQGSKYLKNYISTEIRNPDSTVNKQGLDLLLKMLEPDHKRRISASEALNHPYFAFFENRYLTFSDIIPDFAIDEKPKHHNSVATSLPKSVTKCLLSLNCSAVSIDKNLNKSAFKSRKINQFSSQDESVLSPSTCGTSIGRDFTLEKICMKQIGKSQRTSIFGPMKKKLESALNSRENSVEIHDDDGMEEDGMVDESLKTYKRLVCVKKPKEAMRKLSNKK